MYLLKRHHKCSKLVKELKFNRNSRGNRDYQGPGRWLPRRWLPSRMATKEVKTNEVATKEEATREVATKEVATKAGTKMDNKVAGEVLRIEEEEDV